MSGKVYICRETQMKNSKGNINQELEIIKKAVGSLEGGGNIDEIQVAAGITIERRTLQRRLKELIQQGMIEPKGKGRAIQYHIKTSEVSIAETKQSEAGKSIPAIPLSEEGKAILEIVTLPIQRRKPVGYNRDFLDSYKPNESSYLTTEEKQRLARIGFTGVNNAVGGTYAKKILQRLLIDLAWNSSRLEGNTYSLSDTQRLLDKGVHAQNKSELETQMILNHKDAIEFLVQNTDEIGFNTYTILNLHALLSNNLLNNPADSGRLRTHGVGIGGSVYTPLSMHQMIGEMFDRILKKADQIENPFEQAFFIMVHLPYLQPFDDVNKRVSRLAANIPLNKKNVSPLSFIEVPEKLYIDGLLGVYELNKTELLKDVFLWAYDRSAKQYTVQRQSLGEPDLFRMKYREEIRGLITEIVVEAIPEDMATAVIKAKALRLPKEDQLKFIQTVENELTGLHEGNFARYYLRPAEFRRWREAWRN